MNLQNITKDQIIKNYRELCKILEVEEQEGNSKISQLKEIERFIKWHKDGHSFVIEEIYDSSIPKSDNRLFFKSMHQSVYIDHFSIQLLNFLLTKKVSEGSNFEFMTANSLFQLTGMVNEDYRATKLALRDFIRDNPYSITKFDADEFFSRTNDKMRSITKTALERLRKKYLIIYEARHQVGSGKNKKTTNKDEEGEIMNIKNKIIDSMGITGGERGIYLSRKSDEFYARFNAEIQNRFSWDRIVAGWEITFFGSELNENISKYKRETEELENHKLLLNEKFASYIDREAERKYKKSEKKYEEFINEVWGEISSMNKQDRPFHYQEDFIKSQLLLTDLLIRIKK